MAGNVKVGGNVIATHTGVEGAGTVTLSNVTASALKMSSSGNTITDSAGNAVLSESSGTVNINKGTLGSAVNLNTPLASATFPAGHVIQVVTLQTTAQSSIANGNEFTSIRKSITPIANGSSLMINYSFGHVGASTAADHGLAPIRSTDSGSSWTEFSVGSGGSRNVMISQTDISSSEGSSCSYTFIDPGVSTTAGSAIMYSIRAYTNTGTLYINRRGMGTTNAAISTITITELAG